ncbi:MAG: oligosaccharide flippase family protein [Thermoleophilaceae bacterium]
MTGLGRRAYSRCIASSLALEGSRESAPASEPEFRGLAATPLAGGRSAASDAALFTLGVYAAQALVLAAGLVQKGLLGPKGSGYWALIGTFLTFSSLLGLGAAEGASRQVPTHRGRRDYTEAARVSSAAGSFTISAMAVSGLVLAGVAVVFGGSWAPPIRWGLVILGLTAPLRSLADCHDFLIQATKRFDASAAGLLLRAVVTVTVQTVFVYFFGIWGMFIGLILGTVLVLVMWSRMGLTGFRRPAFRWGIERSALTQVLLVGVPIMIFGQIWQLFMAIDNLIVAGFIDVKNLGYYALAVSVTTYVLFLPKGIGVALFPRMIERYAPSGDIRSIRHYATDVQRILTYLLIPPAIASLYFLLPVLIRQGLPAFDPAIPVVHVMVAGSFFISIVHMPIKMLIAAGFRWQVTSLMLVCLAINAAANYVAVAVLDGGVRGAAIATSASYFTLFLIMTTYGLSKAYEPREVALHIGELLAVFVYLMAALVGVEQLFGPGGGSALHDTAIGVAKLTVCLILLLPWTYLAQRRYNALTTIGGLLRSGLRKLRPRRAHAAPSSAA